MVVAWSLVDELFLWQAKLLSTFVVVLARSDADAFMIAGVGIDVDTIFASIRGAVTKVLPCRSCLYLERSEEAVSLALASPARVVAVPNAKNK